MISQGDMILALAVVLALLSGQGHSEQVGISVELNKRDDGEVGASLYVANATKQLFLNSSLSLRIDAFIDQYKRLISASGYVKETNRNETIELTCDATSRNREIQECQLSKEAELSAKDEEIKELRLQKEKEISAKDEELKELSLQKEKEISGKDEELKELSLQKEKEISGKDEELKELSLQKEKEISAKDEELKELSLQKEKEISAKDEELKELSLQKEKEISAKDEELKELSLQKEKEISGKDEELKELSLQKEKEISAKDEELKELSLQKEKEISAKDEELKELSLQKEKEISGKDEELKELSLQKEKEISAKDEELKELSLQKEKEISAKVEELKELRLQKEKEISAKDEELKELSLQKEKEISAKDEELKELSLQKEKEISGKDEELKELSLQKEKEISGKDEELKELRLQKEKEISAKDEELKELSLQKEKELSAKDEELKELSLQKEKEISAKDEELKELRLQKEKEISAKDEELKELRLQKEKEISAKDEELKELRLQKEKEISGKDKELKELRLQKEKERDEEFKRWSFLCPNEDEVLLRIVSGDDKGYEKKIFRENRTQAADLLIVDGHSYTDFSEDMTEIYPLRKQRCNFFVSDDGKVYEGIGWNEYNYNRNGGLGSKSLIIGFIKKDRDSSPSDAALNKFKTLVSRAICWNVLSPRYSVIPYHLIYESYAIDEQSFERNGMTEWVGYRNNLDFLIPSDEKVAQPIVSYYGWSGKTPRWGFSYSSPIEYLGVWVSDGRCFFSCGNYLKNLEIYSFFYRFSSHFYLAEDGRAYELWGWESTSEERFLRKGFALVMFMGSFHNSAPNKRIFDAFEGLIEEGLHLGKLSPTFKIVPIETYNPWESRVMGKYLEMEIRKHPRFSETM